ncbi:hypothetical protein A3731_00905 [Roseovarius sp. HI0049]|nr:hypothetical protein A3731_00905 [Roseovarius sp. HI0049]
MGLDTNVLTHGVAEKNTISSDTERCIEELRINGYTLAQSGLSDSELAEAREVLDEVYERQAQEVGGEDNLRLMKDANIARAVCAYDPLMLKIATLPAIMDVSAAFLRQYFVLMSHNGILNQPGRDHYQFTWHRDLNYQHYTSSRPLALSALVAIDPFDEVTGGTYVLPGTHMFETFPSDEFVRNHQKVVKCPPGTIIFFDAMLYHRTGKNDSNGVRRAVNHIITPPMLRQQYNFKEIFRQQGVEVEDPKIRNYLGFEYDIPASIKQWRDGKIEAARSAKGEN